MKKYERYEINNFSYPEDMELILAYLNEHGKLNITDSAVEDLYYEFSDEQYCASWMSVNEQMLKEFEEWLYYYDD